MMNPIDLKTIAIFAEIPVLDWHGPDFLLFYAVSFGIALIWSLARRSQSMRAFDAGRALQAHPGDPYEIAFLAGGPHRCGQLAVSRLLQSGDLRWRAGGLFQSGRLVAQQQSGTPINEIENALWSGARSFHDRGIPLSSVLALVSPQLRGIESRLAAMGLRPTESERADGGFSTVLPLAILMVIGAVKLVIGLSRDKPVMFLLIALVITLLACIVVVSNRKRLTPTGERTLVSLQEHYSASRGATSDPIAMSMGLALLGPAILSDYTGLFEGDRGFQNELSQLGVARGGDGGSSNGCSGGVSSGCGGGGGGGCSSGCGGCGGD